MRTVLGWWSALTRLLLHQMFVNDKVSTVGGILPLSDGPTPVCVVFGLMVGDEEAIAAMWNCKGASGLLPCGRKCSATNKPCHTDVAMGIDSYRLAMVRSQTLEPTSCRSWAGERTRMFGRCLMLWQD